MNPRVCNCDVCGSDDAQEIPEARHYTGGHPIHVCRGCGFVYYRERRSATDIAATWSDEIYGAADGDAEGRGELDRGAAMLTYSALTPYAKARQVFVAETMAQNIGVAGKRVCDIGAGQGQFLDILRRDHGVEVFGVEPSAANCRRMANLGIDSFTGIAEDFVARSKRKFDLVTVVWTLENCRSCRALIEAAYDLLENDGHLVVATGSRILVPFKKPLHYYFNPDIPQDAHAFYFSPNSVEGLMAGCRFEKVHVNRYIDSDYLVMIGRKTARPLEIAWARDDYREVLDFFRRWHEDTQAHYANR